MPAEGQRAFLDELMQAHTALLQAARSRHAASAAAGSAALGAAEQRHRGGGAHARRAPDPRARRGGGVFGCGSAGAREAHLDQPAADPLSLHRPRRGGPARVAGGPLDRTAGGPGAGRGRRRRGHRPRARRGRGRSPYLTPGMDGPEVLIIGAGIGGLTLALMLHRRGIACRVYEAAPEIRPLGVGINLLPHATRELGELGLEPRSTRVAVAHAGGGVLQPLRPADLQRAARAARRLRLAAVLDPPRRPAGGAARRVPRARLGADRLQLGWQLRRASAGRRRRCDRAFRRRRRPARRSRPQRGRVVIGCDGIHSVLRKQLHPDEGDAASTRASTCGAA